MNELFDGFKVVVQPPISMKVERTLADRLFKRPWNPLKKYRTKNVEVVDDGFYVKTADSIIMNHRTYEKLSLFFEENSEQV